MWLYKSKPINTIEDLPDSEVLYGFVYKITNLLTGQIYIGKKQFNSKRKKPLAKKNQSTDQRKKKYTHVIKETDWLNYWSSSDRLKEDITKYGKENFKREILELSCSVKYLTWAEIEYQIKHDVLRTSSYNDNVLGKYYRKDMESKCTL